MNNLLTEAFNKAQNLPAQQLIEDIKNELKWQQSLSQPQLSKLEQLAAKALQDSINGKTKQVGFDEL